MGKRDVGFPVFHRLLADWQLQHEQQAFVARVAAVELLREGRRAADVEQGAEDFLSASGEQFVGVVGRVLQAEVLHEAGDGFAAEGLSLRGHDGEGDEVLRRFATRLGRFGRFAAAEEAGIQTAGFVHFDAARFKVGNAVIRQTDAAVQAGTAVARVAVVAVAFAPPVAPDGKRGNGDDEDDEDGSGDAQYEYGWVGHGSWSPSRSMSSSR